MLATQSIALRKETLYQSTTGFGWLTPPSASFVRDDLAPTRSPLTIDGVSGSSLEFRADVNAGTWEVFVWLEIGEFDSNATQVYVQGELKPIDWQDFPPPAEPSKDLPKLYRVFVTTAQVGSDGLILKFNGQKSEVRLLGVTLLCGVNDYSPDQRKHLRTLNSNVGLSNPPSLALLEQETKAVALANPGDSVFALWLQRIEFLAEAERYYHMRGWDWAEEETGLSMFDRHHQAIMLLDALLAGENKADEPLLNRGRFLRGRMLYWLGKERGGSEIIANAERDLSLLYQQFPEDDLLAMYADKKIDLQDECDCFEPSSVAPAWSVLQHEALCRLRTIVRWWTSHRQLANGELGGKFGDDVEMLRWWPPLCLAGDQNAIKGWKRLADGVWHSKHVHQGYARKLADVEHASEFIADTAPLMAVYSDDPEYLERLQPSADLFRDLWTGMTPRGNRFFRSSWFSATDMVTTEPKGRDVEFNCRAVKAVRYLVWRRPDPEVISTLHEWSLAWIAAALKTEKGKPHGILPASVRFTDESINGDGENWYQADMYWDYFDWHHSAGSLLLDQFFFTYLLTKDERLLQPLLLTLELIQSNEIQQTDAIPREGSSAWAAQILRKCDLFWDVVEQWRFVSNNQTFDQLIMRYGSPYGQYRISGDERYLINGLESLLDDLRYNTPLKTSEAYYTDRVYITEWETLKGMLTGDSMQNNTSPYYAVSWEQTDEHFTALVSDTHETGLKAQLFSHGNEKQTVVMRVWQAKPGNYIFRTKASGSPVKEEPVNIENHGQRISVELPAQRLLELELTSIGERTTVD
ncbi:hypothetical protein [Bythopirellula goksoeyrii]|uniref:hypothetical protein n=1 Tax=Bythopirellula goksoeyrii TaxID=1400387 RepID=UPI0011CE88DB|nr:hypothetical protein [Bythopirellula goksoeyrii]